MNSRARIKMEPKPIKSAMTMRYIISMVPATMADPAVPMPANHLARSACWLTMGSLAVSIWLIKAMVPCMTIRFLSILQPSMLSLSALFRQAAALLLPVMT